MQICDSLERGQIERTLLLLYHLLLGNKNFKIFSISKSNLERLVLPLLRTIYDAPKMKTHVIYLATISLLVMSQDEFYNRLLHETQLKPAQMSWFQERSLPAMSLGSFVFLNLVRIIGVNLANLRDRYLHNNCLAALANMTSEMKYLHSVPVQRIGGLFEQLSKRYRKVMAEMRRHSSSCKLRGF